MTNLVGILDTETNRNRIEFDGDIENDTALVKNLSGKLRDYTFRDLIGYMVDNADHDEKPVADEVRNYLEQHNGHSTLFEIRACDSEGNYLPGSENKTVIDLDEKVNSYVTPRSVDGEDFDCIEMVVGHITSVGRR